MNSKFGAQNILQMQVVSGPDQAPTYQSPQYRAVEIELALIIKNGTQSGKPTVDLVLADESGNRYVVLITGALIQNLAAAIVGAGSEVKPH